MRSSTAASGTPRGLFRLSDEHGASAIGEAFRILDDEDPELLGGLSTEGGACHALGRDPVLGERFVDAFDRRALTSQ